MRFFTDITTNISNYCLLNIKKINDNRVSNKKLIYLDPSVYELRQSNEYSKYELLHKIAGKLIDLPTNFYYSIDYPTDMNLDYESEFIEKSVNNNFKYRYNKQYICAIQFKFQNFDSFKYRFEELTPILEQKEKIFGIGNLCRIFTPNTFTDRIIEYIIDNIQYIRSRQIHIYGLALRLIKAYIPRLEKAGFNVSIDSTKWTRAVSNEFKLQNGVCCRKYNRDKYFLEYIKTIRNYRIEVEY